MLMFCYCDRVLLFLNALKIGLASSAEGYERPTNRSRNSRTRPAVLEVRHGTMACRMFREDSVIAAAERTDSQ